MVFMQINVNSSHHYPGSTISGEVFVKMDKTQKCDSIIVNFLGRANARWVDEERIGNVRKRTTYINNATYVDNQALVWTNVGHPTGKLEAGEHHFPFQFQLPSICPPSFQGRFGHVRYEFQASLTPSGLRKLIGGHTTRVPLHVESSAGMLGPYRSPKTAEIVKTAELFFIDLGRIRCCVTLPHTGFSAGESIPISVKVNNQTSRRLRLQATLKRKDTFLCPGHQKVVWTKLTKVLGPRVAAREAAASENVDLAIPSSLYPTIKTCSCVSVEYEVTVKVKIPLIYNETVRIPVVITNEKQPELPQQGRRYIETAGGERFMTFTG